MRGSMDSSMDSSTHGPSSVLLAGGGSAGHVSPLLALADALVRRDPDVRITALGTATGLEARLVPARGYPLRPIDKVAFPRRVSRAALGLPGALWGAVSAADAILRDTGAQVVVGFGGYVSPPAYRAAREAGIPVVIHEQNVRAGLANRLGARHAAAVALTFAETALTARQGQTVHTGLPLRPDIAALASLDASERAARRVEAAARLGLDPERPVLLVTGGSLGAQRINEAMAQAAGAVTAAGVQVLHSAGRGKVETVAAAAEAAGADYHLVEYLDDMASAYAVANLVLGRAGAGTVCEQAALGLPGVYVPLPIGNGEQRLNVAGVESAGGAVVVPDTEMTGQRVREAVLPLLLDAARLEAMAGAARSVGIVDGARRLGDLVTAAVRRPSSS